MQNLEFDSQTHSYGSIYHLQGWFAITIALAALIMTGLVVYWAIRGEYSIRRHVPVSNVGLFWATTTAVWVIGFSVLALTPALT